MSVAWLFGVQLVVFFCSDILLVSFHSLGIFRCHNALCLSSSPTHHMPCTRFVCFYVDSLMGKQTFIRTKCARATAEATGEDFDQVKLAQTPTPSNRLHTVPKRYFCCGSSILHVVFPCVYGLQQYGHQNNSCTLCFLFRSVF